MIENYVQSEEKYNLPNLTYLLLSAVETLVYYLFCMLGSPFHIENTKVN